MKKTYPIVLTPDAPGYIVYIPDFDINTEGNDITEAIEMARDAIGIMGIDMQDRKKELPIATATDRVSGTQPGDIVTLVDIDFNAYRKQNDMRSVRRNVTLPAWLDTEAEKSGVNVSALLQKALKAELRLN